MSRHSPTGLGWIRSVVAGPPTDECLPFPYGKFKNGGYGQVSVDSTPRRAHVVAFEMASGLSAEGLCVLHSCDNPPCCNPRHLSRGTTQANIADKVAKGRHLMKLTAAQTAEVSRRRLGGERLASLAAEFGITEARVSQIGRAASRR